MPDAHTTFSNLTMVTSEPDPPDRQAGPPPDGLADELTGAANRRAFDETLEQLHRTHVITARSFHLLILDLDDLHRFNAEHGRAQGDALLRTFASSLSQTFRRQDRMFRLGGDEFAVIMDGATVSAAVLEERIGQVLSLTRAAGFPTIDVSVGPASYPDDTGSVPELVRLANQRMLRQKRARKVERQLISTPAVQAPAPAARDLVWHALRATLMTLVRDGDLGPDGWGTLLAATVAAVPGAQAGSLFILNGDEFEIRAQEGYSDALLGLRQPESAAARWYGQVDMQRPAAPRVLRGAQIAAHSALAGSGRVRADQVNVDVYWEHGQLGQIQSTLCAPVLVGGRIVAQLNLDNLDHEEAFGAEAMHIASEFAAQVAALLTASERREREAARQRELECLVSVSNALYDVQCPEDAERILIREAAQLLGTPHVAFLRYDERPDGLRTVSGEGYYAEHPGEPLPRGQGLAWAAVSVRHALWVEDASADARVDFTPGEPRGALITAPLFTQAGEPLGVLLLAYESRRTIDEVHTRVLGAITSAGATAMQRIQAEVARAQRAAELRMLADLSTAAGILDEPAVVATRCITTCREFLGAEHGAFFSMDATVQILDGRTPQAFIAGSQSFASNPAVIRAITASDRPILATREYARERQTEADLVATGVTGWVLAPVLSRGQLMGCVSFAWFGPLHDLSPAAVPLALRTAELIGQAYERHAHITDVEATREGALQALGLALELRDFETGGHTERVVALSEAVGQVMGLPTAELEALRQGAYLHDIGKLGIPDGILLKPGKLDAEEWETMKSHARVGYDLAQHVPTLHPLARLVIRDHHERWDGRGYPSGRSGTEIALVARIFSVVDVYDALTSERPYKRAWTREEALAELRVQAGQQFDPEVVEAFARVLESAAV
ncbi:HD domain-containing phosphohydrolase [Deinococcus hohokamensis]|uniref:HD domain-containing phosphohydrolase n=1 Tax=Deinococcus hohokamensis TaxID=309883 RepID=A0ABV9I7I0_9DEIO